MPVSDGVPSSAVSATVGTAVILGISKVIPAAGSVPREIASIVPRSAFDSGLMISVDCGVGISPAFVEVVSSANATN